MKWLRLCIAIISLTVGATGSAIGGALATETTTRTLVVGSEQDYPPFATGMTAETAGGFTVDLWQAIARDAGLNYTLRVAPFHQLLDDFKQGRIDVLINLAQSDERHQFADFSVPHVIVHGAIFLRNSTKDIHSEADLVGKSVLVVKADIGHEYARSQPWGKQLVLVPTAAEGLKRLAASEGNAMFISKLVGLQTVAQLKLQGIQALPVSSGATQKFGFAVRKGDADLLARLNEGLALSKTSGVYDALYHQWFGAYETKPPGFADVARYLLPMLVLFLIYVGVSYARRRQERHKAMQDLAESHHILQLVIDNLPLRVFWKDKDSRYLGCNRQFAEDAGTSGPEEIIGKLDHELSWHPQAEQYRQDDLEVMTTGQSKLAYEEPLLTGAGSTLWLRTSKAPLYDLEQHVLGVLGIYDDITHAKAIELALRESENRLKSLFDNMVTGFALHEVIRDEAGRVTDYRFLDINGAFEKITGLSREHIIGKTAREVLPGLEDYWIENYGHVADTGEIRQLENHSADLGRWFSSYAYRPAPNQFAVMVEDITERKVGATALVESERRLSEILENVSAFIYLKDKDGRYLFANKMVRDLWGVPLEEVIGAGDEKFFDAKTAANLRANDRRVLEDGETIRTEETNTVNDTGLTATYWSVKLPLRRENGEIYALCGISTDISEVKRAQEQMLLASMVYENSSESMMVTDADGVIITINPAFTKTTGFTLDEVRGKTPRLLNSGRHDKAFFMQMWEAINTHGVWQGEVWDRRKNGEIYPKWLTINTTFNADGTPYRRVALFSDITEKKKSEQIIWQQANFDTLTGLPNRHMFHAHLEQELKKAQRSGCSLALLFIDLDRFKEVNDTLGHDKGDLLLQEAAQRLLACVRESDTVARLGGDEFTVILANLENDRGVDRIAQAILATMATPFALNGEMAYVSASIGITLYPEDGRSLDNLLKAADQAMYAAKHQGRNRFSYFTPAMDESAKLRMHLSNDLRCALAAQQFWIAYQPIVELASGSITKAEALIRWQHPQRGLVSPAQFIPVAEENGLIIEIGNWVFMEAARQVGHWRETCHPDFQISVNKSPVQFLNDGRHVQGWLEKIEDMHLPRGSVVIEITEGLLLHADPLVDEKLLRFRDGGMQVAIDDFGTGYSSLSYLKKFDIDYLKIDQSFVRNLTQGSEDLALCEAIIVMAHKLGIKVIAEGVETEAQRDLLLAAGCDYGQGYFFARPMPATDFDDFLTKASTSA